VASAAILAGGRARRFGGADKGALLVGGRRIVERQLEVLRQVSDDIVIVGHRMFEETCDAGVRYVADRVADSGPLGGLDAAFAATADDCLIVIASDMPFVNRPLLSSLVRLSDSVDAVVPRTERGYHPLCAVYRRSCHPVVIRRLVERRLKMVELLEDLSVRVVEQDDLAEYGGERVLANVNTPDELRDLEALLGHEL
jgi:molybdopterin-guanine dinucleotide biosynthesis protein A